MARKARIYVTSAVQHIMEHGIGERAGIKPTVWREVKEWKKVMEKRGMNELG